MLVTFADIVFESLRRGKDDALVGEVPLFDAGLPVHTAVQHDTIALQEIDPISDLPL